MAVLLSCVLLAVLAVCGVSGQPTAASLGAANDVAVLNYALTLENLEAAFYNYALGTGGTAGPITSASFSASVYPANPFPYLQMIQSHENQHVAFLNASLGSSAVPPCTYNFAPYTANASIFLSTAAALENGGQTAYDGALNGLTNPAFATVAAQIATIEARHAAYLNELQGPPLYTTAPAFPAAFDLANTPTAVAAFVAPFIVSCPYNLAAALPSVRPSGVALDSNNNVVKTGSSLLTTSYTTAQQTNDLAALNYALTLEHLEAAFYNYINATFSAANFTSAGFPAYYYSYTQAITQHENIHVSTLTSVINARQANAAVPACIYNFSSITNLTGPGGYLNWAFILENTGVQAYDGAAGSITDTNLQQVAATIATVEARHAAFLNQAYNGSTLGAGNPFPASQDTALTPAQILAAVVSTGLLVNCSYSIPQPSPVASQAQYVGATNATSNSSSSSSSTAAVAIGSSSSSSTGIFNNGTGGNGAAPLKAPSSLVQAALVLLFVVASFAL